MISSICFSAVSRESFTSNFEINNVRKKSRKNNCNWRLRITITSYVGTDEVLKKPKRLSTRKPAQRIDIPGKYNRALLSSQTLFVSSSINQ